MGMDGDLIYPKLNSVCITGEGLVDVREATVIFSLMMKGKIHDKYIATTKLCVTNSILHSNKGWQFIISKTFLSHTLQHMSSQVAKK